MLMKKRVDPTFNAKCNTDAMHWSRSGYIGPESASEKVGMVIVAAYSRSFVFGKQQRDLEFRLRTQLEIRLGDGVRRDKEWVAGCADLTGQFMRFEKIRHHRYRVFAMFEDIFPTAQENDLPHSKIPKPAEIRQITGFITEALPTDAIHQAVRRNCTVFLQVINVITDRGG